MVFNLLQQLCVFFVIVYMFTKSPAFKPIIGGRARFQHKFVLYLTFAVFSILGNYFGLATKGAIANTRAIGAMLGGLLGGPLPGMAVGITSGIYRYSQGGFTSGACSTATALEGLAGGLIHLYLIKSDKEEKIFDPKIAFFCTLYGELFHMSLLLIFSKPFPEASDLVKIIALPMMLTNSAGAALFISVMRDQKTMFERYGMIFSAKAMKIAKRTLAPLVKGFNQDSANQIVKIIHEETGVGAVSITDHDKVMAFVGIGADHHKAGELISSDLTREAISKNKVIYADGIETPFSCSIKDDCPLGSAIVIPLVADNEVLGTIKLYEPKRKLFLNLNKTLGEGIANLLSNQLLAIQYEKQKNLLTCSELKLIQAQINPHFLFNALNTIIAIIRRDSKAARELLLHLSNFFRKNLKRSSDISTIAEELDHVNSYLKIEKARFQNRLSIEWEVQEGLEKLLIPTFTLQPIVENAIKHGTSTILEPGIIKIKITENNNQLFVLIEDNAGNYSRKESNGLGMKIVDKRIKNYFGNDYGLKVDCQLADWTRITIRTPIKEG